MVRRKEIKAETGNRRGKPYVFGGILLIFLALTTSLFYRCSDSQVQQTGGDSKNPPSDDYIKSIDELLSSKVPKIKKVSSCDEIEYYISKFIKDVFSIEVEFSKRSKASAGGAEAFLDSEVSIAQNYSISSYASEGQSGVEVPDYSKTNVQEEGIDEPDYLKTDGRFIYVSNAGKLKVLNIKQGKDAPEKITEIPIIKEGRELNDFWDYYYYLVFGSGISEILVKGNKVFVFVDGGIHILNFDGRDLKPERSYIFLGGSYITARDMGDFILVIGREKFDMSKIIDTFSNIVDFPDITSNQEDVKYSWNWDIDVQSTLPSITVIDYKEGKIKETKYSCEEVYIPSEMNGSGLITTLKFDKDGNLYDKKGFLIDSEFTRTIPYISKGNIYFAFSPLRWIWFWFSERERNSGDKSSKLKTIIYKISVSPNSTEFVAGAELEGLISSSLFGRNTQFSMSEYKGFLRVALEIEEPLSNTVYVLDENLNIVGKVENIGKGERIFAVRFIGDRGYIVTFRQTDPFFVLDLSDPKNPQIKGELKVPGFSTYLHPVGEHLVLALGREDRREFRWDTTLSLYNVSNAESPELITRIYISQNMRILGENWSSQWEDTDLHYDYRALTFFRSLLSIPFYINLYKWEGNRNYSLLAPIFKFININTEEKYLAYKGDVVHNDFCLKDETKWSKFEFCGLPIRTVFIGDYIYTVSNLEIKVVDSNLKEIWKINY